MPSPKILHFLSRLRSLVDRAKNKRMVGIPPQVLQDFKLFQIFITNANKGINMNLCTYRCPTIAYCADACPQGLGDFSHRGCAWRFRIPTHLPFRATLNFLEFIASSIGPWIDILENNTTPLDRILSQTDSFTNEGWLRRSNVMKSTESNLQTREKLKWARDHSSRTLDDELKEYSQWFPGKENEVVDALSRDDHISDQQLTFLLFSIIPQKMSPNFKISPLPPVIVSTLLAILQ